VLLLQVLFLAGLGHVALMPFKNKVHNHLEAGSLVLNFALFDTALLASVHGNESQKLVLGWVLDVIRIIAVTVLVGYGIYENRAGLPSCCTAFTPWRRHQTVVHSGFEDALLTDEDRQESIGDDGDMAVDRGQPGVEDESEVAVELADGELGLTMTMVDQ
jgi:hypothetical protein